MHARPHPDCEKPLFEYVSMYRDPRTGKVIQPVGQEDEGWAPPRLSSSSSDRASGRNKTNPGLAIAPASGWPQRIELSDERTALLQELTSIPGFKAALVLHRSARSRSPIVGTPDAIQPEILEALTALTSLNDLHAARVSTARYHVLLQALPKDHEHAYLLVLDYDLGNVALASMKLKQSAEKWALSNPNSPRVAP